MADTALTETLELTVQSVSQKLEPDQMSDLLTPLGLPWATFSPPCLCVFYTDGVGGKGIRLFLFELIALYAGLIPRSLAGV